MIIDLRIHLHDVAGPGAVDTVSPGRGMTDPEQIAGVVIVAVADVFADVSDVGIVVLGAGTICWGSAEEWRGG